MPFKIKKKISSTLLQGQGQGHLNFYIFGCKLEILTLFVNRFLYFGYVERLALEIFCTELHC